MALHEVEPEVVAALRRKLVGDSTTLEQKYRVLFSLRNIQGPEAQAAMLEGGAGSAFERGLPGRRRYGGPPPMPDSFLLRLRTHSCPATHPRRSQGPLGPVPARGGILPGPETGPSGRGYPARRAVRRWGASHVRQACCCCSGLAGWFIGWPASGCTFRDGGVPGCWCARAHCCAVGAWSVVERQARRRAGG